MKSIFLSLVYSFIRLIGLTLLKSRLAQLVRARSDMKKHDTLIPREGVKQKVRLLPAVCRFESVICFLILLSSVGCGSVQTINGVKYKKPATTQNVKVYTWVCVGAVGFLVWGMYNEKAIE